MFGLGIVALLVLLNGLANWCCTGPMVSYDSDSDDDAALRPGTESEDDITSEDLDEYAREKQAFLRQRQQQPNTHYTYFT